MKTVTKISELKKGVWYYCKHYQIHLKFYKRTSSGVIGDTPLYWFQSREKPVFPEIGGWKWVRSLRLTKD